MPRTGLVYRSVLAAVSTVRTFNPNRFAMLIVAATAAMMPINRAAEAANSASDETCYNMLLVSVLDGDTVFGYIDTSDPIVAIRAKLRLIGIDTPERGYRAQCAAEKAHAEEAHAYLKELLEPALSKPTSQMVRVCAMKRDKYALRRLGRLELRLRNGWVDTGELMLRKGYAIPYQGRARGTRWCDCLEKGQCPSGFSQAPARPSKSAALQSTPRSARRHLERSGWRARNCCPARLTGLHG